MVKPYAPPADCAPFVCPEDICFIECTVEQAFCGLADKVNVSYVQFKQAETDANQDDLSQLYSETCVPVYSSPVIVPAIWDPKPKKEDIKAHGTEIKPDVSMTLNLMVLDKMDITLSMKDRFQIQGKLYELRELDENYGMAQLRVDIKLELYLVD